MLRTRLRLGNQLAGVLDGCIPVALPVVPDGLAHLDVAKVAGSAEPFGRLATLVQELEGAGQLPKPEQNVYKVAVSDRSVGRVHLDINGQGLLKVGHPARIATAHPCHADIAEAPGAQLFKPQVVGHRERLPADPNGLLILAS